ncbi:MAG: HD domain-containing protein [Pseudomonadota bacterium]
MAELADLRTALRKVAARRMSQDPAHDLAHLDRVWINATTIANGMANQRVLLAASYLHDLVNLPKDSPDRHLASRRSGEAAVPFLQDLGYLEDEIVQVCHAIEAHSFSAGIEPESTEACILRDADRLDALGAIGIARNFSVSGSLNRALYDPGDPFGERRPLDDTKYSLDHWRAKLLALPEDMLTDAGRAVAENRLALMLHFLEDFARDIGHAVPDSWTGS